MDKELKELLKIMNANIQTIARDQAMIYAELKEIEDRISELDEPTG